MKTSAREDILEALCVLSREGAEPATINTLSSSLSLDPAELHDRLAILELQGDLQIMPGNRIALSEQGRETGCRVMRKHKVLECFLSDMLGMDPGAASEEACILEHDISDEAFERLDRYLARPRGRGHGGRQRRDSLPALSSFPEGSELQVLSVKCPGGCQRLFDMGIVPGERIRLIRTLNNKAVVIQVKGCDIALSPEIASCIFVVKPK